MNPMILYASLTRRIRSAFVVLSAAVVVALSALVPLSGAPASATGTGLAPGSIQHVWLIILENKSYDETFTGLNNNSYLWQTLPSEGVLLKNYYGTGHSSMDNYISMVSGQAPEEDTQEDCSDVNTPSARTRPSSPTGTRSGGATPNWNFGQSPLDQLAERRNAPLGATGSTTTNGCTYPSEVATCSTSSTWPA